MAFIYTNENIESQLANALRRLRHDVLTSLEAGNANRSIADWDVLAFAVSQSGILITHNRLHFVGLHQHHVAAHAGIVVCSVDLDYSRQAQRVSRGDQVEYCGPTRAGKSRLTWRCPYLLPLYTVTPGPMVSASLAIRAGRKAGKGDRRATKTKFCCPSGAKTPRRN